MDRNYAQGYLCSLGYTDFCYLCGQIISVSNLQTKGMDCSCWLGCVPPETNASPPTQAMGRFEQEFIERRRAELERFLRRVAMHSDLARSGPFLEFCTTATPVWWLAGLANSAIKVPETTKNDGVAGHLADRLGVM